MKQVVAVSGGVDSVVLLDMLATARNNELIVAHFDHGIRDDSAADARFVEALAQRYGLPFETERVKLGKTASEETARSHRYAFLRKVAAKYDGTIVTAHHQNDIIESIAINLQRGTGWRGLAVMNDPTISRPLANYRKTEVYDYATTHNLEWVEDETNHSNVYLRNHLRRKLARLQPDETAELIRLYHDQLRLSREIEQESKRLMTTSRYFLTMIDDAVAVELLRALLLADSLSLTRPQRLRLLQAIKAARPGDIIEPGSGIQITFTKRDLIVKYPL